jgi:hypothetical protein
LRDWSFCCTISLGFERGDLGVDLDIVAIDLPQSVRLVSMISYWLDT